MKVKKNLSFDTIHDFFSLLYGRENVLEFITHILTRFWAHLNVFYLQYMVFHTKHLNLVVTSTVVIGGLAIIPCDIGRTKFSHLTIIVSNNRRKIKI